MVAIHHYDATSFIYVKVPTLVAFASDTVLVAIKLMGV